MRAQAIGVVALLLGLAAVGRGADEEKGFFLEQRVHEATRLDWEFAAGPRATLPGRYDSRQQRYQLFVPPTYKATKKPWPLVVFVSPGDDPLGWPAWRKPCEEGDWFFAAAYGAGNSCPPGQRVRAILDVLDDVRQHYRIDPDQSYLAGFGGGCEIASRIAFALPEHFGGVIALSGDVPLPPLGYLRRRSSERLSVALVCGSADRTRREQEKYYQPLLQALDIRSKLWLVPDSGHTMPPAKVLVEVQRWLEKDLPRRQADRKERIGEETPTRREMAAHALKEARKELEQPDRLRQAAAQLEWLVARWPRTEAGEKASELLADIRADRRRGKVLAEQIKASRQTFQKVQAHALEESGRLDEARLLWERLASLPAGEERTKAEEEAKRLSALVARRPYLGIAFAGDTTTIQAVTPRGPAHRAGLRAGDRLEQVGKAKVATPEDVRAQLREHKPGDKLVVTLRRNDKPMSLTVTVGSPPVRETAATR